MSRLPERADLSTYKIEGYLPGGETLDLPLYSLILEGVAVGDHRRGALWMGGTPATYYEEPVPDGVEAILDLFGQPYKRPAGVSALDHRTLPLQDWRMEKVSDAVIRRQTEWIEEKRSEGKTTLVHCQAGINRSSLIVGSYLKEYGGLTGEEAVALIREKRSPLCFANKLFLQYVLGGEE